ncbi:hypothetical protein [Paenibacillus sp. MER 99-2]|uniref:hypothetical protein n=1 Tax=Paenibacillus sp. MER 99-2 TaxID=2939572 RepID=UPI00203FFAC9|nr:hypothetical protein [Paenibacillus sp. MER 99-2]MCM3176236.1 hypothetical protein [Paenibacillus sp. MER 99-2]
MSKFGNIAYRIAVLCDGDNSTIANEYIDGVGRDVICTVTLEDLIDAFNYNNCSDNFA